MIRNLESKDWKTCHGCPLTQVCNRRNCNAYKQDNNYTDADHRLGYLHTNALKVWGLEAALRGLRLVARKFRGICAVSLAQPH